MVGVGSDEGTEIRNETRRPGFVSGGPAGYDFYPFTPYLRGKTISGTASPRKASLFPDQSEGSMPEGLINTCWYDNNKYANRFGI